MVTGALFFLALVLNVIASALCDPILDAPNYLELTYPHRSTIVVGSLLNMVCAVAMAFIPLALFPVTSRHDRPRAVAYTVFRFTEGLLFLYLVVGTLSFIGLGQAHGGAPDPVTEAMGRQLKAEMHWATLVYVAVFVMGAATFYPMLYRSGLVPRFLSVWGMIATGVMLVAVLMGMFGVGIFGTMSLMKAMAYFAPPIALNELVLSGWLVFKGFRPEALRTRAS